LKKINEPAFFVLLAVIFFSLWFVPTVLDMPNLYLINEKVITFSDGWTWKGDGYADNNVYEDKKRFRNTVPAKMPVGGSV